MNPTGNATDEQLALAIDAVAMPGVLIGHRLIAEGDDLALLPEEMAGFAGSVIKVRRASGAARIVARQLMSRLGRAPQPIPRSTAGMPVWPGGIVGSLAHDARIAVAVMARQDDFLGVGVDIEPAEPLGGDLLGIVATATERRAIDDDPHRGRLLFSIKEAIYKAVYPLDGTFLDHHDVEVDLPAGTATVRKGRVIPFRYCVATHIMALAFVKAA
jgi:4'-phosphopantetheinyl transferase EntD